MPSLIETLLGIDQSGQRGQSPLVGLVMGADPQSQAAATAGGRAGHAAGEAVKQYLSDVLSGVYARKGAEALQSAYQWDPSLSALENVRAMSRSPRSLDQVLNLVLAMTPHQAVVPSNEAMRAARLAGREVAYDALPESVLHPNIAELLRKYGLAGLIAGNDATVMQPAQAQQGQYPYPPQDYVEPPPGNRR